MAGNKEERHPRKPSEVSPEDMMRRPSYTPQSRTGQETDEEGETIGPPYTPQERTEEEQPEE